MSLLTFFLSLSGSHSKNEIRKKGGMIQNVQVEKVNYFFGKKKMKEEKNFFRKEEKK